MSEFPNCPKCESEFTYSDGVSLICPMCHFEWTEEEQAAAEAEKIVRDANGNELFDGDSATVIKDLKLSGSERIKQGTKVTKISILDEPYNDHDIQCQVEGHGRMYLKSEFVKKKLINHGPASIQC